MYLIERHLQLEIYFSLCEQLPQDCATIRDYILESIRLTEEKLHIIQEGEGAITKVDSFLCSCGKGSAHHTCAYNPLSGILECTESEETGEGCKLDPQHSLWLGECTLHSLHCLLVIVTFCTLPLYIVYHIILYINFGIIVIISHYRITKTRSYYSPAVCNRAKTRR